MRDLNILVTTHGEVLAHTTRALMIAEELRARGANIAFAMRGDKSAFVEAAGFPVFDIVELPLRDILRRQARGTPRLCGDAQAAECTAADLRILDERKPDIVLTDFRPSMAAAARIRRVPHISVLNATWTPYLDREQVRILWPEHTRFGPALGRFSRFLAGPDLARWRSLDPLFRVFMRNMLAYGARPFRKVELAHGLAPSADLFRYWLGDLTLVPDFPSFMPIRRDAPETVRMIGPLIWQGANSPEIDRLASTLNRTRPTVYVTVGSTGDPGLFRQMIDAAVRKNWNLIVTTAGLADLRSSGSIHIYDFLPGEAAMRLSDVTICQGGSGTINQAIAANCPFVGVASNPDQEWNLDRARQLGIAKAFHREDVAPERIVRAVDAVLARKEAYRSRFSVFDEDKRKYLGATTAVDAIEAAIDNQTLKVH